VKSNMTEEKLIEYNFSNHAEILEAIDLLYEKKVSESVRPVLRRAIEDFLHARTNSELIDIGDLEPSIWDYNDLFVDTWYKELNKRNIPQSQELKDLLNEWHPHWIGKSSKLTQFNTLIEQVGGIQKKLDKLLILLDNRSIRMKIKDALKL